MHRRVTILLAALMLGVCVGVAGLQRPAPVESSVRGLGTMISADLARQIDRENIATLDPQQTALIVESLARILDEEISERRVLEEQLVELRVELGTLQQRLGINNETDAVNEEEVAALRRAAERGDSSTDQRLVAAGFTPPQVEAIRRLEAEEQMKWIELDDRARREGWINSPQYFDEINDAMASGDVIQRSLGDDRYDQYLYASGRPNRIAIGNVIATSPAEKAGLQPGDVIASYGGERVFSTQQLTRLRSTGDSGMPVTIEIIRDGQLLQLTLPRGPIGIGTRPEIVDPASTGG